MMRYALSNQLFDIIFSFSPLIVPVGDNVSPSCPKVRNVTIVLRRTLTPSCSGSAATTATRCQRHLWCVRSLSAMIALQWIQRLGIRFDEPAQSNSIYHLQTFSHKWKKNTKKIQKLINTYCSYLLFFLWNNKDGEMKTNTLLF